MLPHIHIHIHILLSHLRKNPHRFNHSADIMDKIQRVQETDTTKYTPTNKLKTNHNYRTNKKVGVIANPLEKLRSSSTLKKNYLSTGSLSLRN